MLKPSAAAPTRSRGAAAGTKVVGSSALGNLAYSS